MSLYPTQHNTPFHSTFTIGEWTVTNHGRLLSIFEPNVKFKKQTTKQNHEMTFQDFFSWFVHTLFSSHPHLSPDLFENVE
jgi:hypothetical protein